MMSGKSTVHIVGGGLAGCEAALYLASRQYTVYLYEMRPEYSTPAHQTGQLAELVCSNSLKSQQIDHASGLLKEELSLLGSYLLPIARQCAVPAGKALAVDRQKFSQKVEEAVSKAGIERISKQIDAIDPQWLNDGVTLIATGPLTTDPLMFHLKSLLGAKSLFFFDAIAPVLERSSVDQSLAFWADRYGEESSSGDYCNCPMDEHSYRQFWSRLVEAETAPIHDFERSLLFERCQPIEEIAKNGIDAMRYGPMKPVGLVDPHTGSMPYAVVQLRAEDNNGQLLNMVGFQTRLKWSEQKKVFRMIPALHRAEFCRYGVMHKNTYIQPHGILNGDFSAIKNPSVFFCGQFSGVEGYVESIASGWYVARQIDRRLKGQDSLSLPDETMLGSLMRYLLTTPNPNPMYANFGILPSISAKKREKRQKLAQRSIGVLQDWIEKARFEAPLI